MAELKTPVLIIHTESPNTDERNFVGHYYVELRDANGDWVVAGLMPKQTGGNPLPQPGYIEYAGFTSFFKWFRAEYGTDICCGVGIQSYRL